MVAAGWRVVVWGWCGGGGVVVWWWWCWVGGGGVVVGGAGRVVVGAVWGGWWGGWWGERRTQALPQSVMFGESFAVA